MVDVGSNLAELSFNPIQQAFDILSSFIYC